MNTTWIYWLKYITKVILPTYFSCSSFSFSFFSSLFFSLWQGLLELRIASDPLCSWEQPWIAKSLFLVSVALETNPRLWGCRASVSFYLKLWLRAGIVAQWRNACPVCLKPWVPPQKQSKWCGMQWKPVLKRFYSYSKTIRKMSNT